MRISPLPNIQGSQTFSVFAPTNRSPAQGQRGLSVHRIVAPQESRSDIEAHSTDREGRSNNRREKGVRRGETGSRNGLYVQEIWLQQFPSFRLQCLGDLLDVVYRDISLASLDRTDISPVHSRHM